MRPVRMTFGAARAVFRALRMRPALVHLHDPELIPWIWIFRLFGVKTIFDAHEDITATGQKAYVRRLAAPLARLSGHGLLWIVNHFSTGVVTATPEIRSQFNDGKIAVVQNFPVLASSTLLDSRTEERNSLVYVGWLTEARGAWQMLDAIAVLGETHSARLRIAGWIAEPLLSQLRRHPGWLSVDFLGGLDRDEVTHLLHSSTAGIVVFLPSKNHIASQPTKMFEYMAAEIPVIASDYPLWRQMVLDEGAGVVVDPEDVSAIVKAAADLFDDPTAGRRMGAAGRRIAERERNWTNEGVALLDLYRELVGAPS